MKLSPLAEVLWGNRAKFAYVLAAALILLLTLLGAKEIWTQEHRWADIVSGMFYRQDFLHPYLGENRYYDKPLLSYWLIVAVAWLSGSLDTWALRLPSALSGILAIWAIYRLGIQVKSKQLGLMAAWLLLTTFYFVFWARTSSADMLNLAGSLFAVAWYMDKENKAGFLDYVIFFLIIALTALCKGLVGVMVPMLAVLTHMCLKKSLQQHFTKASLYLALIPALVVYLLPFWASNHFGGEAYGQSGLYMVFRENVERYFSPFDHQGPIYTYFIYLPIYLLPWTLFFIPALSALPFRFKNLNLGSKWLVWTLFILFAFFTLSGSRRSYYVLPIVPFAILFTADWIINTARRSIWAARIVVLSFVLLLIGLDILPAYYYSQIGVTPFAQTLKAQAEQIKPWEQWQVVMLDGESKLNFYLNLPPTTPHLGVVGSRDEQTKASLLAVWPILNNKPADTIFISRQRYLPIIKDFFHGYEMVILPLPTIPVLLKEEMDVPVAFIPKK